MNGAGEQFRALPDTGRGLHPEIDDAFAFREVIESPLLVRRPRATAAGGGGGRRVLAGLGQSGDRVGYCVVTLLGAMAPRIEWFDDEDSLVGGYNNALEGARRLGFWAHPPPPTLTREDFVVAVAARVAGSRTL
jgi:hypothetical protein